MSRRLSHVIGFDDGPFDRGHRGDVMVVGAVYSALRLEGVLSTRVRRDGVNATRKLIDVVQRSRFAEHVQALLTQGIAFAGFNVIDLEAVHRALRVPVIAISRKRPDLRAIERALREKVPGGARKWRLIEQAGPMEPLAGVYVQRAGIDASEVARLIDSLAVHGQLPEPLRAAHLIAGGIVDGESRHRA